MLSSSVRIKLCCPGCVLCPILCPWLPLRPELKADCEGGPGSVLGRGRGRGPELDRVLESEEDIRSQDTDHCKYKYIMLSNGIKVTHHMLPRK